MKVEDLKNPQPGDHCLLCGGPPEMIGVFVPDEPLKWGAAAGKTRLIRYCLCLSCHGRPETPEKVEKVVRSDLSDGGASCRIT